MKATLAEQLSRLTGKRYSTKEEQEGTTLFYPQRGRN